MFLSMLTADAAAQHGHEYSNLRIEGTQRRSPISPIPRYPFSAISTTRQRQLHGLSPLGPGKRPKPPTRSQSVKVTMAELRDVPEEKEDAADVKSIKLQLPGTYPSETSSVEDTPAEEPVQIDQDNGEDLEDDTDDINSATIPRILIEETLDLPPPKRVPRPKCQLRLAHPPPTVAPKKLQPLQKHIRPKVLLQLQQRTQSGFHKPIYEVVPASRFSTDTRLGKKLNRLRKGKDGLHPDDLVVLKVEDYKGPDDASEEAEFSESRTALGIISVSHGLGEDKAVLQLENSAWIATAGKSGSYDLVFQEDETQRAKWYIQKSKRKRPNSIAGFPLPTLWEEQKFYFALIQPRSRQHPTVASINGTYLDIYDYHAASMSSPRTPTRPTSVVIDGDASSSLSTPANEDERIPTSDLLRKLIVVSGAWVFFKRGWSPFFRYAIPPRSSANRDPDPKPIHARSTSMPISSLVLPCQRRMQRDSSPSSISKASSRSSTVHPPEDTPPTSTTHNSCAPTSTASDISPLATAAAPSPIGKAQEWVLDRKDTPVSKESSRSQKISEMKLVSLVGETSDIKHESRTKEKSGITGASETPSRTTEPPKAIVDDSFSDSDILLQSPSYWQEYDLFHERSFQRKLEQVGSPIFVMSREVSTGSDVPPNPESKEPSPAIEEEIAPEPKPLRRTSTLRSRVMPVLSKIKSVAQKRVGS